ncbi:NucA/NucB deoxyribonuclease domain-containing protein [Cohnella faecalis]|uniref:DNA-entry nuclease n=1 Tax=Cohnella faecalis TaxID=2315694 RepID=A0A398CT47_9BACL|nr:NucA/NucB deoxyribonuclease domain-containing protein [Cohnella faecalis]RIE04429.1 DNA-entry nuclease [Cohnella faecalis]
MKKRRSRKKDKIPFFIIVIIAVAFFLNYYMEKEQPKTQPATSSNVVALFFPTDQYPETGRHIKEAIAAGESAICTIDRDEAEERRKESLKGIPTKKGYDRDEWPMAMCAEGGSGADIKYIDPSDNRGAGSWVSNQLEDYPDGTRVEFVFRE